MNRREFLCKSGYVIAGTLISAGSFSRVCACDDQENGFPPQPRIALIIDDIGYSVPLARSFLQLNIPLSFSILPRLPYSRELSAEIRGRGHDVMLHQPMQPYNTALDPGPGALYEGDDPFRISEVIEENLSGVPDAIGVNNHMGSLFTECQRETYEALQVIKNNKLFFIDSRTSRNSKALRIARGLHLVSDRRNVFLDTVRNESTILLRLRQLKRLALRYGHAIGIGHPFPDTARAIERFVKGPEGFDMSFVHISDIMQA